MPLIDMPLAELRNYTGTNPKPSDHDPYWAQALAEMRSVDPQVELVPNDFSVPFAECYDLWFTGVRGARIHAKYLRPVGKTEPHPAVLLFHGYGGHTGSWWDKLAYVGLGFSFAALDCRGQAGQSQDTGGTLGYTQRGHIIRGLDDKPENLLFRHIFLDTAQLASIVMGFPEVDAARVGCMGGSQGGGLSLACAALEPRIRRVSSTYPFLCDYQRVWKMDLAVAAYEELRIFFRSFDPLHEREEELFTRLGYIDVQHLADRIEGEVLMGVGLMDTVCPPSTQFAAYNKIRSTKSMAIYPDYGHEGLLGFDDRIYQFLSQL